MNNLREQFNSSVAETVAGKLEADRDSVMRTLTNPIKLGNVADTVKHMPSDVMKGIKETVIKTPVSIAQNLVNVGKNVGRGHNGFCLNEMGRATKALVLGVLAPNINIGKRFASSVRDNQ